MKGASRCSAAVVAKRAFLFMLLKTSVVFDRIKQKHDLQGRTKWTTIGAIP
jgi:hypothetical protein